MLAYATYYFIGGNIMTNDFEQLSNETLAKIKGFGIKSKSVVKFFKQSCRMLGVYLTELGIEFSFENAQNWLSTVRPCDPMSYSQYVKFAAWRRSVH